MEVGARGKIWEQYRESPNCTGSKWLRSRDSNMACQLSSIPIVNRYPHRHVVGTSGRVKIAHLPGKRQHGHRNGRHDVLGIENFYARRPQRTNLIVLVDPTYSNPPVAG